MKQKFIHVVRNLSNNKSEPFNSFSEAVDYMDDREGYEIVSIPNDASPEEFKRLGLV